ncbi:unnamed protein product [Mytilus coruscus]|uniref:Chitin-binding type-2 domain-containing protein n=1 Tax=Mytilus coruscus TaxID=42192 RepID=A0A6J8AD97_MYTCO|nr:unnamed protein product [Mytilus coruscus]
MWTRLFQALLLVVLATCPEAYNKTCPHISQRTVRGHFVCTGSPTYYSCLFDTNRDNFKEYCKKPDFSAPGEYYVFTGSRRNIECKKTTYQPNSLWSNESSRCIFKKSLCIQIGQILYKLGSATEDTQCRCDYTKQYAFVVPPLNICSCTPSEEDCSCYIKQCEFGYILNADYQCKPQNQKSEAKCIDIENPGYI